MTLASIVDDFIQYIAVDSKAVYASSDSGFVYKVPLTPGGSATTFWSGDQGSIVGIVANGGSVYWGLNGEGVYECDDTNCATPMDITTVTVNPIGFAVDATNQNLYVANEVGPPEIAVCTLPGCNNTTVLFDNAVVPNGLGLDSTNVYWTDYGTLNNDGTLQMCAVGGCGQNPTLIRGNLQDPGAVASDSRNVYWADENGTWSCAIANCNPTSLGPPSSDIVVDSASWSGTRNVYWSTGNTISRCPTAGCPATGPIQVATARQPFGVALDSTRVYWVDTGTESVMAIAK